MKRNALIIIGLIISLAAVMALGYGGYCAGSSSGSSRAASSSASWKTPVLLETDNSGDVADPVLAMNGSGNAVAIWPQSNGVTTHLYAKNYIAGTGWAVTNTLIETESTYSAFSQDLAMNANGCAVAIWLQADGTRNNLWTNRAVTGTTWSAPALLESSTEAINGYPWPQVAINNSGNAIAIWIQSDGITNNIYANRYISGTGWAGAELVENDDAEWSMNYAPQVALDNSGNATAVWVQNDGTWDNIYANRYISGTGWAGRQLLEATGGNAGSPQIAIDNLGNAMAVWSQDPSPSIYANRYVSGTGWAGAVEIDTGVGASVPQVAMNNSGNAVAVWNQGAPCKAYGSYYISGTSWATAQLISDGVQVTTQPQIAMNASGNAMALWYQYDGSTWLKVWANRYVAGTGWAGPASVGANTNLINSQRIVLDASGNAIAVWSQQLTGQKYNLWANRFE